METNKQAAASFLLNLVNDLEPRPAVRAALVEQARAALGVLLEGSVPAPAPAVPPADEAKDDKPEGATGKGDLKTALAIKNKKR